ncbi:MAG: DUF3800 domain-containing protein [Myxococcota bacterium]
MTLKNSILDSASPTAPWSSKQRNCSRQRPFALRNVFRRCPSKERTALARECLREGASAKAEARQAVVSRRHLAALAQAKLDFCERVLELCTQHHAKAFASIVDQEAPTTMGKGLRKDYAYLFERFFYFLDERGRSHQGIVVFDEKDRQQCVVLLEQMASYFKNTAKGRHRASRVIPEPFFVRSELSTLVQVADIIAYVTSWGVRIKPKMTRPARGELKRLADYICEIGLSESAMGNAFTSGALPLLMTFGLARSS